VKIALKVLQVLLIVAFLGAGGQKLAGAEGMVSEFERYGYPDWFMYFTGAVEVTGAAGLLLGFFRPLLTPLAALLLTATMVGAVFTHVRLEDPVQSALPPSALLVIAATVSAGSYAQRRLEKS